LRQSWKCVETGSGYVEIVQEKLEDTKGIINIRKTKKDRQYNDLKEKVQKYKTTQKN